MFSTTCIKCGAEDSLYVTKFVTFLTGVPLTPDGFSIGDAKQVNTEDEWVQCSSCDEEYPLADLPEVE